MSLRDNNDIMTQLAFYPHQPTFHNYVKILTDPAWYMGYVNSFAYVSINTVISLTAALPAWLIPLSQVALDVVYRHG